MKYRHFLLIAVISFLLSSCEFSCKFGNDKEVTGAAKVKDGARLYNNIELFPKGVKVSRAYLLLDNGERVPDDNFVDFKSPVKLQLLIDSGWVETNGRVLLGASEKIISETGIVLVDEPDLFQKYPEGITPEDARSIFLSASLKLKEGMPPTYFSVVFRVWDKNGNGSVEGNYKLYSK
jgi:hypothetical protein